MSDQQDTSLTRSGVEGSVPADGGPSEVERLDSVRSGDFSHDPAFDPEQLFRVISCEENAEHVSQAMHTFLANGDVSRFEQAVAVFVRSARARGEAVERVLAVLIGLAEAREGTAYPHDWTLTDLRLLVLRGVLLTFYGETSVAPRDPGIERRSGDRRRGDARSPSGDRSELF